MGPSPVPGSFRSRFFHRAQHVRFGWTLGLVLTTLSETKTGQSQFLANETQNPLAGEKLGPMLRTPHHLSANSARELSRLDLEYPGCGQRRLRDTAFGKGNIKGYKHLQALLTYSSFRHG